MGITPNVLGTATGASTTAVGSFTVPAGGGLLVVSIINKTSIAVTMGMTVDGVAMSATETPSSDTNTVNIFYAVVAAGSRVLALTGMSSSYEWVAGVTLLTGYDAALVSSPVHGTNDVGSGTANSLDLNIAASSVAIYAHLHLNTNGTTWGTATGDLESGTSGSSDGAVAHYVSTGAESPHTETTAFSGATFTRLTGATWAPDTGGGGGGGTPGTLDYRGASAALDTNVAATHDFGSFDVASDGTLIVVFAGTNDNLRAMSGITAGGVAMNVQSSETTNGLQIILATLPVTLAGGPYDIQGTYALSPGSGSYMLAAVYLMADATAETPDDLFGPTASSSTTPSVTANAVDHSCVVMAWASETTPVPTPSFDTDLDVATPNARVTIGHKLVPTAETPHTESNDNHTAGSPITVALGGAWHATADFTFLFVPIPVNIYEASGFFME